MDPEQRQRLEKEIAELRERLTELESELEPERQWPPEGYYGTYHGTTGFVLGGIAAIASLLFNVVGSLAIKQHPLRLIQVYLTFPLGEKALSNDFNTGIGLAIGCCLYIATGMVLGIVFQMAIARFIPNGSLGQRLGFATLLGIVVWAINFYGILSWLQPLLFGGDWIVNGQYLPSWVAGLTHLVFAWTMALLYPWGAFVPYRPQTEMA